VGLAAYHTRSSAAPGWAAADAIDLVVEELVDRYGAFPDEVTTLVKVARLRRRASRAGLSDVVAMGSNLRIAPARFEDSMKVRLQRLYPKAKLVGGGEALVVPMPVDADLIEWVGQLFTAMFPEPVKAEPAGV
jgi:transcription-repair coupling factor (superfamily II helicase)